MVNGYRILDADCHVLEPDEVWTEGLSTEFKQRAPHFIEDDSDPDVAASVERFGWRGLEQARFKYVIDGHDVHHCVPPVLLGEISRKTDELMPNPKKRGLPAGDMLIALERMGVDVAFPLAAIGVEPAKQVYVGLHLNGVTSILACGDQDDDPLFGDGVRHARHRMCDRLKRLVRASIAIIGPVGGNIQHPRVGFARHLLGARPEVGHIASRWRLFLRLLLKRGVRERDEQQDNN